MGVVRLGRGATAMLAAAGGILLATITATLSPRLIMQIGAALGVGAVAETAAIAQSRTSGVTTLTREKIEDIEIPVYKRHPQGEGTWPGVVVLHDGWGLTYQFQETMNALADKGFLVLALDMNEGKAARDADKARELSVLMDEQQAVARTVILLRHLKLHPTVGDHRVGMIGFGTGAKVAFQAAMESDDLSALALAYPAAVPAASALRRISCPILGLFGGKDETFPAGQVDAFRSAMKEAGRSGEVKVFETAGHAFMNPADSRHDRTAAAEGWSLIVSFFGPKL